MSNFSWPDDDFYGIELLDIGHRELFRQASELDAAIRANRPQPELLPLFDAAFVTFRARLEAEEALLRKAGYSQLALHKREHDDIVRALIEFRENVAAGSAAITESVLEYVHHWFVVHREHEDRAAAAFLNRLAQAS